MRKPIAMLVMLTYLAAYVWLVASLSAAIGETHSLVQLLFYILAGLIWVLPLKPLFAWMNVGTPPPE